MSQGQLILVFAALHGLALVGAVGLLLLALSSGERADPPEERGGDGGSNHPPRGPSGGPPLADAVRARKRLRSPERLFDRRLADPRRRRPRHPARAPERPSRKACPPRAWTVE